MIRFPLNTENVLTRRLGVKLWLPLIGLLSLVITLLMGLSLPPMVRAQAADGLQNQTSVSVAVRNIRVLDEFKGKITIRLDEGDTPLTDSSELNLPVGGTIVYRCEFPVSGTEFGWSVEINDDGGNRLLFLRGGGTTQGQAWYTEISVPGRDRLDLTSVTDREGVVTIRLLHLQALLNFKADWKEPDKNVFRVSFALDGDGNGVFDENENSVVEASPLGGYLQAESNPLASAKRVADFSIAVTDKADNKVVTVDGKCDFETNEWTAHAWFDREKVTSVTVKPMFKGNVSSVSLPNLISIAANSEGSMEPGWQEGAEMTFTGTGNSTVQPSPSPESTTLGKSNVAKDEGGNETSPARTDIPSRIVSVIEDYWMIWIPLLVIGIGIVALALIRRRVSA